MSGRIVLIIDDAGYSLDELEPFLRLPWTMSIAVLPGLPHSAEAARRIRAAGKSVFLHAPMEPEGGNDPGPGAILVGMSAAKIRAILAEHVREIGPIEGINNHMGSRATADTDTMRAVLEFARSERLVFLDSRTTAASVAEEEAKRLGITVAARDVFLDYEPGVGTIRLAMDDARRVALRKGYAVVIGHVQSGTLAAYLREELPRLEREGFAMVPIREVLPRAQGEAGR